MDLVLCVGEKIMLHRVFVGGSAGVILNLIQDPSKCRLARKDFFSRSHTGADRAFDGC